MPLPNSFCWSLGVDAIYRHIAELNEDVFSNIPSFSPLPLSDLHFTVGLAVMKFGVNSSEIPPRVMVSTLNVIEELANSGAFSHGEIRLKFSDLFISERGYVCLEISGSSQESQNALMDTNARLMNLCSDHFLNPNKYHVNNFRPHISIGMVSGDEWRESITRIKSQVMERLVALPHFPVNGLNLDYANKASVISRLLSVAQYGRHHSIAEEHNPLNVILYPTDLFKNETTVLTGAHSLFHALSYFDPCSQPFMRVASLESDKYSNKIAEQIEKIMGSVDDPFRHNYRLLPTDIEVLDSGAVCIDYELPAIEDDLNIAGINDHMIKIGTALGVGVDKNYLPDTFRPRLIIGSVHKANIELTREAITANKNNFMKAINELRPFQPKNGALCAGGRISMLWNIEKRPFVVNDIIPHQNKPTTYSKLIFDDKAVAKRCVTYLYSMGLLSTTSRKKESSEIMRGGYIDAACGHVQITDDNRWTFPVHNDNLPLVKEALKFTPK